MHTVPGGNKTDSGSSMLKSVSDLLMGVLCLLSMHTLLILKPVCASMFLICGHKIIMFKQSLPQKNHKPVFASDVSPDGKPKKTTSTLPKSLNNYETIRDKVIGEMQTKVTAPTPRAAPGKKKLLDLLPKKAMSSQIGCSRF